MEIKPINIVLIGRSGAGKGTQAELLKQKFPDLYHVISGDLFRNLRSQNTDTAFHINRVLKVGGLPYDDLATTLWMYEIAFNVRHDQGILADGMPRRLSEAKSFDSFLEFLDRRKRTKIIYLDISEKEAFKRLAKRRICKNCGQMIPYFGEYQRWQKCGLCNGDLIYRFDDKPKAIRGRLEYFKERVVEVINYYKEQNRLIVINGEQDIQVVHEDIMNAIGYKHLVKIQGRLFTL